MISTHELDGRRVVPEAKGTRSKSRLEGKVVAHKVDDGEWQSTGQLADKGVSEKLDVPHKTSGPQMLLVEEAVIEEEPGKEDLQAIVEEELTDSHLSPIDLESDKPTSNPHTTGKKHQLSTEQQWALATRARNGDQEAINVMTLANDGLVHAIASRYLGRGLEKDDLEQHGRIGLMKACTKYDPTKGFRFSTYAIWWIREAIQRAIANESRTIRLPVHLHDKLVGRDREADGKSKCGKDLPPSMLSIKSLDVLIGDEEEDTLVDLIPDETTNAEEKAIQRVENARIWAAIEEVISDERERQILHLRYDIASHTTKEVADKFGVTAEWIRKIEARAINRLLADERFKELYASETNQYSIY